MFCQECGTENKDGAKFCYKCGKRLTELLDDNGNEKSKKETFDIENLSELQYQYVNKINEEVVLKFCMGRSLEPGQFYDKASIYDLTKKEVNEIVLQLNKQLEKMYRFIEIQFEESKDFTIDEEEIYEYAELSDIEEETVELLLEKYKNINFIDKKAEFYQLLLSAYSNFVTDEAIKNYKALDDFEKKRVEQVFEKNIKEINEFIDKEYIEADGLDLKSGQLPAIVAEAIKIGVKDEESFLAFIKRYEDEHGITKLKNDRDANLFYEIENQKLGKNVNWFGKSKIIEGKLFLSNYLTDGIIKISNEVRDNLSKIDQDKNTILGDVAIIIAQYGSEILEEIQQIEEELSISDLSAHFAEIQEYIIDKVADISAVSTVINDIDENVEVQKAYRELRKQFRNQWSGGGFGIAGALKGAAMAGVLNMGAGAVHSVANAIGNAQTNSKARAEKRRLIHNVIENMPQKVEELTERLINNIKNYVKEKYPKAFWEEDERVEIETYSLFKENYEDNTGEYAWNYLMSNPYKENYYMEIFKRYANVNMKQELNKISNIFNVTSLSNDLNSYIDLKINDDLKNLSITTIDNIYNWLEIKFESLDERQINKELAEVLHNQLLELKEIKLKDFIKCLLDYSSKKKESKLVDIYDEWVKDIANSLECQFNSKADTLDKKNIEEEIDKLIILKELAKTTTKEQIDGLISHFLEWRIDCICAQIDCIDLENISERQNEIERIQNKYKTKGYSIFEQKIKQTIKIKIENSKTKEELYHIQRNIENIVKITHINMEIEKNLANELLEHILLEERTVYDYFLECDKDSERKKPYIFKKKEGTLFKTIDEATKIKSKVQQIERLFNECDFFSYESVNIIISKIDIIYKKTGFGKDVLENLKAQSEKLDIERRTVLEVLYDTFEEAENERKKVVGNKKFESEEEANAERKRLQREREVEEQEKDLIAQWEAKGISAIDMLKNILENKFTSLSAQNKEKEYTEKVLKLYSSLKEENLSLKLAKLQTKQLLGIVFGVIAIILGIGPFLASGWIGKVVIVFIVSIPWGIRNMAKEESEKYIEHKKVLTRINNIFDVQGTVIKLKNINNMTSNSKKNNLVKVCVVEKYRDKESGRVLEPGFVFETSTERATQLVKENVVKRVD